jgi:hypothetical protein
MYTDKQLEISNEQAITSSEASDDFISQGAARDAGMMDKVQQLCFTVKEAFVSGGATTLQVELQCDEDAAFGSAKSVLFGRIIPKAELVLGFQFYLPLPIGFDETNLRAYYNVATGPFTAGKLTAGIVAGVQKNQAYPDAL